MISFGSYTCKKKITLAYFESRSYIVHCKESETNEGEKTEDIENQPKLKKTSPEYTVNLHVIVIPF